MTTPVSLKVSNIVLDTPRARALAEFYRGLLGWSYRPEDEPPPAGAPDPRGDDWLVLRHPDGGVGLAFQHVDQLTPPTWPDETVPQQLHLDLTVPNSAALHHFRDTAESLGLGSCRTGRTTRRSRCSCWPTRTATRSASSSADISRGQGWRDRAGRHGMSSRVDSEATPPSARHPVRTAEPRHSGIE